jgi:hypothetical protein
MLLPLRWGRIEVGVDKIKNLWSPFPLSPPTAGRGVFCCRIPKNVRDEFSDLNMQELKNIHKRIEKSKWSTRH